MKVTNYSLLQFQLHDTRINCSQVLEAVGKNLTLKCSDRPNPCIFEHSVVQTVSRGMYDIKIKIIIKYNNKNKARWDTPGYVCKMLGYTALTSTNWIARNANCLLIKENTSRCVLRTNCRLCFLPSNKYYFLVRPKYYFLRSGSNRRKVE